ncbi:MAG: 5'/3'-nucleotidase SurE [Chloroflexota bacterium]
MNNKKPNILLTNDDGIDSPGIWAAAEALSEVGYVWVVAPREQSSGAGRSMPSTSDGIITKKKLMVHGVEWDIYAVGGSPAQTIQHGVLEIMDEPPDLVVSGINYGLNVGHGITISGTVGAAIEGAAMKIPAIAVSLETEKEFHLSHSKEIDFSAAGHFTALFARQFLTGKLDKNIQVIKIDVPASASIDTPWAITKLSKKRFYLPAAPERDSWNEPKSTSYSINPDLENFPKDSDVYKVVIDKVVSVTPSNLYMTAQVDFSQLESDLTT